MSQVTIYLDPETEAKMRAAAQSEGISQSKWIAKLIQEKLATSWPESFKALAGSWSGAPTAEELRQGYGEDLPRESF